MDPSQRQLLFEQLKIVIPDDYLTVLELAVEQGYVTQSQINRCLPSGNGNGVPTGLRRLLQRLDLPFEGKRGYLTRKRTGLLAGSMETDNSISRRRLHGVSACLSTIGGKAHRTKAEHLAMAREMEDQQRIVLDILLRIPILAAEFDAWARKHSNGYQPNEEDRRLGQSIKRRSRHEWWPFAMEQLKRLYELRSQHAELGQLWRDNSNQNADQRRNYRRQMRRMERSLGCDGQGLDAAIQSIGQALKRYVPLRAEMIDRNGRLTISVAKRYSSEHLDFEDRILEGTTGLIIAVDRYDWRLGYNLSTYAMWWIRQAITRAIANQERTIRLPVYQTNAIYKERKVRRKLDDRLGHYATDEEVAAALGTSVEKVEEIIRHGQSVVSLDRTISDEDETSLKDILPDPRATDPSVIATNRRLRSELEDILSELTVREARIVRLRNGLTEDGIPRTLEEIGALFNVTRERVRQIEAKALRKLRHPKRIRRLIGFHETSEQLFLPQNIPIRPDQL